MSQAEICPCYSSHARRVPARPALPTLTLKGKVPAPSQRVAHEHPAVDTAAASCSRVEAVRSCPAPKPAPVGTAAATDAPAKNPLGPFGPWARSRVPSTAGPAVLARAQALNALLVAPVGVLRWRSDLTCVPSGRFSA